MSLPKTSSNLPESQGFSNLEFTTSNSIEDDSGSEDLAKTESTVDRLKNQPEPKKTKNLWWLIPVLGLVLAVGGVSVMRIRDKNSEQAAVTKTAPLNVRTVAAQQSPIRNWVSSEGTVRAVRFKHLAFDVDGEVTYIADRDGRNLREGDRVTKGELLAQIDDRELQADVNKAQAAITEAIEQKAATAAEVAQAQSQVAQARAQVGQMQAQLNQAEAARNLAQSELNRYQQIFNEGAISASDIDFRRNDLLNAEAQVQSVEAQVISAQAQIDTAQAQVKAARDRLRASDSRIATAQAQLSQAQVALEGTKLFAPFDGIVAYKNIRENEYYSTQSVSSQLSNYQGLLDRVPIVVIDPSQFEVTADLSASVGEQVRSGQTTVVAPDDDVRADLSKDLVDSAQIKGKVFAVNPAVTPGGRAIQVTSRMTGGNAPGQGAYSTPVLTIGTNKLLHGSNVTLWIAVAQKDDAVVVPLNAVVFRDRLPYVFVANSDTGKVEQRQVKLGIEGLNQREILEGVSPGELLVTEGQNRLVNDAPVNIMQ